MFRRLSCCCRCNRLLALGNWKSSIAVYYPVLGRSSFSEAALASGSNHVQADVKQHDKAVARTSAFCPRDFRFVFPDFLPDPQFDRRNHKKEILERNDMLQRRLHLDIPEFYVGSILAVTVSDPYAASRTTRFVGICIQREGAGLKHHFTLRNCVDGMGVEVKYEMYNPLIRKIELLKLEKRLDDDLFYLRDALPEYSTFPFDMEPVPHTPGAPVPINPVKVKLSPTRWGIRWEHYDLKGVEPYWDNITLYKKTLYTRARTLPWKKFDLIDYYRSVVTRDDEETIYKHMMDFQNKNVATRREKRKTIFHHHLQQPHKMDE